MESASRLEDLRRRVQQDPASIAFAQLAEEYRRAGRFDEAISTCRIGLARHPGYVSARVTLGRALLQTGQLDQALQELQNVHRVAPENLAGLRTLADVQHRRGALPDALALYQRAQRLAPNDPEIDRLADELARQTVQRTATLKTQRSAKVIETLERWLVAIHAART